jgi:glycosyltransferase involved in cell wall biosynthesis
MGRYPDLARCLAALAPGEQQDAPPYEVLVIDQTPPEARTALLSIAPHARQVFQDATGLSVARNLGITLADGDIIAFLDDDAVPSPRWAAEIAAAFAEPQYAGVLAAGGRVVPEWPRSGRPPWMTRSMEGYLSCIDWGDTARFLRSSEWIVGANMAFRCGVFEEFGLFDTALGRKGGGSLLSNEETALIKLIGHDRVLYQPRAQVIHVIPPERVRLAWFRRRSYWQAVSDIMAGSVWVTRPTAYAWLAEFIAASPAEHRSLRALFQDVSDPEVADMQLRAVYGLAILAAGGFEPLS